jgi:hypothetical protein
MEPVIVINEVELTLNDILNNEKLIEYLVIDVDMAIEQGNKYFKDSNYYKTELKVVDTNNTYKIFYGYYGENWIGCILLENNDIIGLGDQFNDDCLIPDMIAINSWYLNFIITEESYYI